jgi:hypothetical protein
LPPFGFTYGKTDFTSTYGAAACCNSWIYNNAKTNDDSKNPRNFIKLNKKAHIEGLVTA